MSFIKLEALSLAYGHQHLLTSASFQLAAKEKVALVGLNGAGKSTLMKLIEGSVQPDSGTLWRAPSARIATLPQALPAADNRTVSEVISEGLGEVLQLRAEYERLSLLHDERSMSALEDLQHKIEAVDGWMVEQKVDRILSRLQLDPAMRMSELSGGWRKRTALGAVLVREPDVLLLDEPTNHLDIDAIEWLEKLLLEFKGALLFVSHDRTLVDHVATSIAELDRGQLTRFPGNYSRYLEQKERMLAEEERHQAEFDRKLALEERWIRQGIKARRTRNEGRVRALEAMRVQRQSRRERQGKAEFSVEEASKSGKLVLELEGVSHRFEDKTIIDHFSLIVQRGDRIGLIGPNGAGKSTLLKIMLGHLLPDHGHVKFGTKMQVAYFDQMRDVLDPEKSIIDNVSGGRDFIDIQGQSKHIISYLSDFLFSPERARTLVKSLSGGENNRVLLAKLLSQPANLLVLDEPTNDLDMETLELLEAMLVSFGGTVLLVSHDRAFLDNVITSSIVFEGQGVIQEYVGGYQDWLRQRSSSVQAKPVVTQTQTQNQTQVAKPVEKPPASVKKLSYKLQKELDELPSLLESAEDKLHLMQTQCSDPEFYQQDPASVAAALEALQQQEALLEKLMERWVELDAMSST